MYLALVVLVRINYDHMTSLNPIVVSASIKYHWYWSESNPFFNVVFVKIQGPILRTFGRSSTIRPVMIISKPIQDRSSPFALLHESRRTRIFYHSHLLYDHLLVNYSLEGTYATQRDLTSVTNTDVIHPLITSNTHFWPIDVSPFGTSCWNSITSGFSAISAYMTAVSGNCGKSRDS